jgi:2-dehydro-3-deoxy-D-gluconate 5-dehydrogenase
VDRDCFGSSPLILDAFRLHGKTALVTGASRGLGAAIALALSEAGAAVVCHGNSTSPDPIAACIQARGGAAATAIADLIDPGAPSKLFDQALSSFGTVDILVNNAGLIRRSPAIEYAEGDWADVLQVNLTAAFRLSQLAAEHMLSRGTGGKILNIASLLSFQGGITVPAYAAAKGGLAQLTKALANEWAAKDINVNAIAPGYMTTDNTEALRKDETRSRQILERIPAGRWGAPEDVTGAAVFLCSDASRYIHGQILAIDGGWLGR